MSSTVETYNGTMPAGISKRDALKTFWKSECMVPIEMMEQPQKAAQMKKRVRVSWESECKSRGTQVCKSMKHCNKFRR